MTVAPGFAGQLFIHSSFDRIKELKEIKENGNFKFLIEVEGGVGHENIGMIAENGADIIVSGHAVFDDPDHIKSIANLYSLANK